jgi:hypothetical protein
LTTGYKDTSFFLQGFLQKECRKNAERIKNTRLPSNWKISQIIRKKFGEKFGVTRLLSSGWILAGPVPENYPGTVN